MLRGQIAGSWNRHIFSFTKITLNCFPKVAVCIFSPTSNIQKFLRIHLLTSTWCPQTWILQLWHPTPVLLPGQFHGQRSLVGCSPWGREESDTTERLHFHFSLSRIGEGKGNPLQCSCLENPRDGGAWWAAVYGVTQSRTRLKRLSSSSSRYSSRGVNIVAVILICISMTANELEHFFMCLLDVCVSSVVKYLKLSCTQFSNELNH